MNKYRMHGVEINKRRYGYGPVFFRIVLSIAQDSSRLVIKNVDARLLSSKHCIKTIENEGIVK